MTHRGNVGKHIGSADAGGPGCQTVAASQRGRGFFRPGLATGLLALLCGCGGNYAVDYYAVGFDAAGDLAAPKFGADATTKADAVGKADANTAGAGTDQDGSAGDSAAEAANPDGSAGATDALTADQDAATGGSCGSAKACSEDAECPSLQCSVAACKSGCCVSTAAAAGSPCEDGDACTTGDSCGAKGCAGKLKTCDDGKDCTSDSCDPASGKCASALAPGWCQISGNCLADGQPSLASACKVCDSAKSTESWSLAASCCAKDADCPKGGACDVPTCDLATNLCGFQQAVGCCVADQDCSDGNACTIDSCDAASGTCAYKVAECQDPSPCQTAICDGKSGECKASTKAGWCLINGTCQSQGAQNAANGCQVCDSLASQDQWTVANGIGCNDGNPCTFNDMCGPGAKCAGTIQQGCCLSDADCAPSGNPCTLNSCDAALGLCLPKAKPGCCTTGTCCDAATKTIKPAKTVCGTLPVSTQYQCSGQDVQQRDITAGCNGTSGDGCSTAAGDLVTSAWKTIQSCASGTLCTASGSSVKPTCKSTVPAGSCANSCGGKSGNGVCYCDSFCTSAGDCCADFKATCSCSSGTCCDTAAGVFKAKGSACPGVKTQYQCVGKELQKRTDSGSCDGKGVCGSSATPVWGAWAKSKTCTSTQNCAALADLSAGDCYTIPPGSCVGACGTLGQSECYCDAMCTQLGDCCGDYVKAGCAGLTACGGSAPNSCKGICGKQSSGSSLCWCDSGCETLGDCCADKALCACQ